MDWARSLMPGSQNPDENIRSERDILAEWSMSDPTYEAIRRGQTNYLVRLLKAREQVAREILDLHRSAETPDHPETRRALGEKIAEWLCLDKEAEEASSFSDSLMHTAFPDRRGTSFRRDIYHAMKGRPSGLLRL